MGLFERIVVCVGDAEKEAGLLRYAGAIRDLAEDAELYFVHVLGWPTPSQFRDTPTTHAQALGRLQAEAALNYGADGSARCWVLHGNVIDRLLESVTELDADLILVGHGREHSGRRSLARRLAMQAPCSVWMRPGDFRGSVRRVLAAVDYSEPSAYALGMAARIARRAGNSECQALHVYRNEGADGAEEYRAVDRARELEAFARFTAPLDTAGVNVRPLLEEGGVVAHAVDRLAGAEEIDLVVMGSRGQSPSASTLLGSESEHVLMESKIPVLIAKRRGERIGLLRSLLDRNFHLQDPPRFG